MREEGFMRSIMVGSLAVLTLTGTACYTLKTVSLDDVLVKQPSKVWVTRADQSVVLLEKPQLLGDTLVGHVNGAYEEIPASQQTQVRMRTMAAGRTIAVITVAAGSVLTMAALLAGGGGGDDTPPPSCQEDPTHPNCY
jgi:hypothetical protein